MGPILSRHYVACSPAAQGDMTLRQIAAHLVAVPVPDPVDEQTALMAQHPALRRR